MATSPRRDCSPIDGLMRQDPGAPLERCNASLTTVPRDEGAGARDVSGECQRSNYVALARVSGRHTITWTAYDVGSQNLAVWNNSAVGRRPGRSRGGRLNVCLSPTAIASFTVALTNDL